MNAKQRAELKQELLRMRREIDEKLMLPWERERLIEKYVKDVYAVYFPRRRKRRNS